VDKYEHLFGPTVVVGAERVAFCTVFEDHLGHSAGEAAKVFVEAGRLAADERGLLHGFGVGATVEEAVADMERRDREIWADLGDPVPSETTQSGSGSR
jgi:hypothetical protein